MIERSMTFRTALLGAFLVAASGCDDGLTELNENPNAPTLVGAEYLLANGIEAAVTRTLGASLHMDLTALWVQHYAESQYSTEDRYDVSESKLGHLEGYYVGPLEDFHEVIRKGRAAEQPNATAMGLILKSWTYNVMTDLWGDIGYSEALQGQEAAENMTPAYDPQQQVYAGLFADLREASGLIDEGAPGFETADLIYHGDMAAWRRFSNSLRLRFAMRLSEADAETAETEFAAALAAGVFSSNADNARLVYVDDGIHVNPLFGYQFQQDRDDHVVSAALVDTLQSLADPRLAVYANANVYGTYAGMPNGTEDPPMPLDSLSRIGAYFTAADAPVVILSYAEVLFLEAEAAERGWIAGDPAALYAAGIRASMEQYGVAETEIDTYLAQPAVAYAGLPSIALQKWIALYGNGPEAYAEWRRTGFPALVAGPDALNGGTIPVRLPYPSSEQSLNRANLEEAVARQGGAGFNDPLWWDQN